MNLYNKKGFTLTEIMIVIVIIAILVGIAAIFFQDAKERDQDAAARSALGNIKALNAALPRDQHLNFAYGGDTRIENAIATVERELGITFPRNPQVPPNPQPTPPTGALFYDVDNPRNFCAWVKLHDGSHWCIDSTCFKGEIYKVYIDDPPTTLGFYCRGTINRNTPDEVRGTYRCEPAAIVGFPDRRLYVSPIGNGTIRGTITEQGTTTQIIDCGKGKTDCDETVDHNTRVRLTATPAAGYVFTGWSGTNIDCEGTGDCTVTMTADRTVTATFSKIIPTLTVEVTGPGTVTSTDNLIDCPGDCSQTYAPNASVTLIAVPDGYKAFLGWGGACSGTFPTCTITMNDVKDVTALFVQPQTLTVSVTGSGTVTSSPVGIDCGTDCTHTYAHGTSITLTASPASGWTFAGWRGDCSGTGTCTVSMAANRSVTATFTRNMWTLTVIRSGLGTVTSLPIGINCGVDCTHTYTHGTSVTLTASPASGWTFAGWEGACTGTGTCTITMDAARDVIATFAQQEHQEHTLTVNVTGPGTVTSDPANISCVGVGETITCEHNFAYNKKVTLTAKPADGWSFVSWGDACYGTATTTCTITMDADISVQANFLRPAPIAYFLFDTQATSNGHLGEQGGREGADAMCAADPDKPAVCTRYTWAFISVHNEDEVNDFPTTIRTRSGFDWNKNAPWFFRDRDHDGVVAADNFADLLDSAVTHAPKQGGIDRSYWTGTVGAGIHMQTCSGFRTEEWVREGVVGNPRQTDHDWLGDWAAFCDLQKSVLCACF